MLSKALQVTAFVLVLLAVITFALGSVGGVNPEIWAWGGVDAFFLSLIV